MDGELIGLILAEVQDVLDLIARHLLYYSLNHMISILVLYQVFNPWFCLIYQVLLLLLRQELQSLLYHPATVLILGELNYFPFQFEVYLRLLTIGAVLNKLLNHVVTKDIFY